MSNKINGEAASCGNCAHSIIENGHMLCTFNPPSTAPIVVVASLPNGQLTPNVLGWLSNFPTVNPERKCGQHKRQFVMIDGDAFRPPGPRPADDLPPRAAQRSRR